MDRPEPTADDYFIPAGEGSLRPLFPGIETRTTCGDQMMFSVVTLEPHSVVPEHDHPHEQMGILISGRLEFIVGGISKILNVGDIWRIPGGVKHKVITLDEPAVALDVFHPIREDYR